MNEEKQFGLAFNTSCVLQINALTTIFFFIRFLKIQLKNLKNQIAKVSMYSDVKIDKQAVKAGTIAISVLIYKFKLLPISKNPLR